jgi:hypothetical protein
MPQARWFTIALAVTACVAALQAPLSALTGLIPAAWLTHALSVVGAAAALHLALVSNPILGTFFAARKAAAALAAKGLSCLVGLVWAGGMLVVGVVIAGCTPAQLQALNSALQSGQSALVPAEALACQLAADIDPTGGTAICTAVDASGNALGLGFTVVEDVTAIVALLSHTTPTTTSATKALAAAHEVLVARRAQLAAKAAAR